MLRKHDLLISMSGKGLLRQRCGRDVLQDHQVRADLAGRLADPLPGRERGGSIAGSYNSALRPHYQEQRVLYDWHPWAGRIVTVHSVLRAIGRCSLTREATGLPLEVPLWMFDRDLPRVASIPPGRDYRPCRPAGFAGRGDRRWSCRPADCFDRFGFKRRLESRSESGRG